MDKNCSTRNLHQESNSSSVAECLPRPRNISRKSLECAVMDPTPKEASAPPAGYDDALHETSNSSCVAECLPRPRKQPNIRRKSLECAVMDPSPKEAATVTTEYDDAEIQKNDSENAPIRKTEKSDLEISSAATSKVENMKEDDHQCDKNTLVGTKSSKKEIIDPSQEKKLSTNAGSTSETQNNATGWYVVSETEEDSPEKAAAKALELEYMNKYASECSEELLFAIDVMTLVRYLNNLECKYIMYATSGNAPTSPCDDTLDQALKKIWAYIKNRFGHIFESQMKNKAINYQRFQEMMLYMAETEEQGMYDEKSFLTYCLVIAQWAVCAENNGVSEARDFIPLVTCRTIQNLKDSGKLPSNFWERIAEKALDIINGIERL
ncbi:hypothetical protein AVEN_70246-1 [Araneus ventricosus]|uniref:Uncharacterized protein n=1 Tax=Araneus ventricosus TaxID=182803 RepID=A0A4Y2GAA6_ARAVE|nr:hypothetical protein AVEN_70246-1 [Araneus ventricosus]